MTSSSLTPDETPPFALKEPRAQVTACLAPGMPQVYYGMSFENIPDDLVISLNELGEPLTRLTDLTWVLTQFKLVVTDKVTYSFEGLKCEKPTNAENTKLTQILFLMRLFSDKGSTRLLRASSQFGSLHSLLYLCKYADNNDVLLKDLFHQRDLYRPFLESLSPQRAGVLWQILRAFNITKCPKHWFLIPAAFMKDLKKLYRGISHHTTNQHPVIPPRILNLRWGHYNEVLGDFMMFKTQLTDFLRLSASNPLYARGSHSQNLIKKATTGLEHSPIAPDFDEAARIHGLYDFFQKYSIRDAASVPDFLGLTQYCAKALIHILTLMRAGEALLLETKCLEPATGWCEEGVYIIGISTKATGKPKDTKWITVNDVQMPLDVLSHIYEMIQPSLPLHYKNINNFFISPNFIGTSRSKASKLFNNCQAKRYEARLPPIPIEEEDLFMLELIDPSRDWRSEKKFMLGEPWSLTTHQFRRTMTVYCAEDSLMKLGPLKRTLGHLSRRTTEHYQKGCSAGLLKMSEWSPETVADFKRAVLDASNAIYIRDILYSEDRLHGLEGRKIQASKDTKEIVLSEKIGEILARKKKGLIACTSTPIGLCLSLLPCAKRAHADFSTCDSCSESVIKLQKLDYVIEISRLDLAGLDPRSTEYRMDAQNLQDLEDMRSRLIAKAAARAGGT